MTPLEDRHAKQRLQWVRTRDAFTTVNKGFGFVVYYRNNQNWLAVLSKDVTAYQLKVHKTKPPEITGFWNYYRQSLTERMFEVPVTNEFLTHVIESTFPEMLTV